MFKVLVLSSKRVLYEDEAWSVFVCGDLGEFEVLENHKPIISLLKEGDIVIDWEKSIPVKKGIVRMHKNELVALVEE
jgi:F-type H+-transporting ATPase subunit epsilon